MPILPFTLLAITLALALPAQASSLIRTFVSATGKHANPRTVTAPCRTFAGAYANTAANGIIAALDPAGYGPLTITGPVTVDGNGFAAMTAPSGVGTAGITINAGSSDKVVLRGLTVDGAGAANTTGIVFNSASSLTIDGCVVRNMQADGLDFLANTATPASLAISNSHFDNNSNGIFIQPQSSGAVTASIDRTELNGNNGNGLEVNGGAAPALSRSQWPTALPPTTPPSALPSLQSS